VLAARFVSHELKLTPLPAGHRGGVRHITKIAKRSRFVRKPDHRPPLYNVSEPTASRIVAQRRRGQPGAALKNRVAAP
jgi:hypothetical protein